MEKFVFVAGKHPLSKIHRYVSPPLCVEGKWFSSVDLIYNYVCVYQDGKYHLAEELRNSQEAWGQPSCIQGWLWKRGYQPTSGVLFRSRLIYQDILVYLLSRSDNPYRQELVSVLKKCNSDSPPLFVVCSNNCDFAWDCGLTELKAKYTVRSSLPWPGRNLFGRILTDLSKHLLQSSEPSVLEASVTWSVRDLLRDHQDFGAFRPYVMLLLADSMWWRLARIQRGVAVTVKGGWFFDLVSEMQTDEQLDFHLFQFVIVCCGINDAQGSKDDRRESWKIMEEYLLSKVNEGFPPERMLVSLPVPHVDAPDVWKYSEWITRRLNGTGIRSINWSNMPSNMFHLDGFPIDRMYADDFFHLNHCALYRLWQEWSVYFPELETVAYDLKTEEVKRRQHDKRKRKVARQRANKRARRC
jgi:hypothetical protein